MKKEELDSFLLFNYLGGNESGRKIIVYDPIEVKSFISKDKVRVIA